jgi:tellurite resistance protein
MDEPDFPGLLLAFRGKGGRERDRVLVGVAAAFAHIVAADGQVLASETQRFLDVVTGSRLAPGDPSTAEELSRAFDALLAAVAAAPRAGREACLRALGELGADPVRREIIGSAARAALVADAWVGAEEIQAESEVRAALGLPAHTPR